MKNRNFWIPNKTDLTKSDLDFLLSQRQKTLGASIQALQFEHNFLFNLVARIWTIPSFKSTSLVINHFETVFEIVKYSIYLFVHFFYSSFVIVVGLFWMSLRLSFNMKKDKRNQECSAL